MEKLNTYYVEKYLMYKKIFSAKLKAKNPEDAVEQRSNPNSVITPWEEMDDKFAYVDQVRVYTEDEMEELYSEEF